MFRGVAIALIPFLLAGCGGEATRVTAPPTFGSVDDLVAWVSVAPIEFRAGENAEIEVGVRNPTNHPIEVAFVPAFVSYVVKNSSGITVAPQSFTQAVALPFKMAPGQAIAVQLSWDGTVHYPEYGPARRPAPPGEYQVGSFGLPRDATLATPVTICILAP